MKKWRGSSGEQLADGLEEGEIEAVIASSAESFND